MFERCIYFNSNALVRKINSRWDAAFKVYDIPPSHGYLIRLILSQPGISQQQIAHELALDKSTIARFVNKLELNGWLLRSVSESDSRGKKVMPAEKALALQDDLSALGDQLYATMCNTIGEGRLKSFVSTLREISEKL